MATHQLKKPIADLDVPEVPEFLAADRRLRRSPVGLPDVGRHEAPDEDDLYDEVEDIISASDFIEKTEGAQLLFI